jgi:mannosyltransferase OCH1-like enzyme
MLLSNVLITSSDDDARADLPAIIRENVDSLKRNHAGLEHRLFGREATLEVMRTSFSKEVVDAFHSLRPFAYQADLARYCILYEFGGLYADLAYYFVRPLPLPENQPLVFRGNLVSSPWDTSNGLIYAPPKHKALARAIELVCANVKRRYYGLTPLCPTGPALFGKALAQTCEAEELVTGSAQLLQRSRVKQLAPDLPIPADRIIHCQLMRGTLLAVKRKPMLSPGLSGLGISTGNSYRDLWENGEIYG